MSKILLYIGSMQRGGAQRVMCTLSKYLLDCQEDVVLVNDILPDPQALEYPIDSRIKRYFLDEGNDGKYNKNLYRLKRLRQIIKREQPQTVLSFLGEPNLRMLIATIGLKVRKIVSVRNDPTREYGTGIKKVLARLIFRLADGCVFQTQQAADYFGKAIMKKSQIIFNPVHEKFFQVSWKGDQKEIAVVGRLQAQKNPLLALKAFSRVANEFADYKLIYYGEEELKTAILDLSKQMGLTDRVIIYGKAADVEEKLVHARVYVLSSDYEGMPNALLEALAVGTPAISTDCPCGGPRTIIQNPQQGVLVPVKDVEALAQALRKVLADEQMCHMLSENERLRAKAFRSTVIMKQWHDFLFKA